MSIFLNKPKKYISNNSESNSEKNTNNNIEITPSVKETIIKFNMNEIETERIKNKKQIHTSPIIRRTPNTKTDIIIQKIYSNRRNIIKNINSKNTHFRNFTSNTENNKENEINLSQTPNNLNSKTSTQFKQVNLTKSLLSSSNLLSYPLTSINSELSHNKVDKVFIETEITDDKNNLCINSTDNDNNNNINNNTSDQNNRFTTVSPNNDLNINNSEYEKSSPSTDISSIRQSDNRIQNKLTSMYQTKDETCSSSITSDNSEENYNSFSYPYEKKKRKHYKNVKMKKYIKDLENKGSGNEYVPSVNTNDNIFVPTCPQSGPCPLDDWRFTENQYDITSSKKNTPLSSPRTDSNELWNETIENYYMEFQKICKDESKKYKCLSKYNEIISKILKFLLLVSGCFTFTLSITVPNSSIMTTTTTISSVLTTIITSIIGFFQFEKTSEIQYNIYKELDKLYSIISLELLKPTYMRNDPYELILLIQNRRDELLKTLHKK